MTFARPFSFTCSLVLRPSDWGGRGKEGLVSTVCACAVIIQILNNPITYGYRLYTFTDTFTVKYTENIAHAHAVDTRPSFPLPLPPIRRPGDEATSHEGRKKGLACQTRGQPRPPTIQTNLEDLLFNHRPTYAKKQKCIPLNISAILR